MKKYTTVAMAAVRPIVWKLLLIVLAMTAVETGLFLLRWYSLEYRGRFINGFYIYPRIVYSLALIGLTAVIMRQGGWLSGGKSGYKVRRLPVPEGTIVLIWAAVYFAAYIILQIAQIGVVFGLWKLSGDGNRVYFAMKFYTNRFLHGLFPMENIYRHIYNLVWPLGMSLSLSFAAYARRRGAEQIAPYALLAFQLIFMGSHYDIYGLDLIKMIGVVLVTVMSLYYAWRAEDGQD